MISTVCVCGAGTMGLGIATLVAGHGYPVLLYDVNAKVLSQSRETLAQTLSGLVDRKKISAEKAKLTTAHLRYTADLNDCIADLVIEAIHEDLPAKTALFNQLAEINHSETIFATNTSSLSVSEIAAAVMHPSRVLGMHFFNPPVQMKLVELVSHPSTDANHISMVTEFCNTINKTIVRCHDSPGFIVNRVARPFYIEALHLAEKYRSSYKDIDELTESSCFRMGPFRLMDMIGNDINLAVSKSIYNALNHPHRLQPSAIQEKMVTNGELGVKSGKGFYEYGEGRRDQADQTDQTDHENRPSDLRTNDQNDHN